MRQPSTLALAAAALAWLTAPAAGDDQDPAVEARLLVIEGKFREADGIIERAAPEVQNDPALRLALGEAATRFANTKTGEEKREALFSARQHFAKVIDVKPAEGKAAAGILDVAKQLAQLDTEAKKSDDARAEAKFALEHAEKALAAGIATTEFKIALGRMYGFRASFVKTMKDVDQLVSDSSKAASLLSDGATANAEQAGKLLSEASSIQLRAANLIHEGIPKEDEKRDDEALASAVDLATKACLLPAASEKDFATHLDALLLAHAWGLKTAPKPFMTVLAPPLEGLRLEIPRAPGWTRTKSDGKASDPFDLVFDRRLDDDKNPGSVQVMLKVWKPNDMNQGKPWSQINEIAPRRFDKYKEDVGDVSSSTAPVLLGGGKNLPEVWHYEVSGTREYDTNGKKSSRTQRIGEWLWADKDKKKEMIFQLKIIDWRPVPDIEDPDIVAFVCSALGEGVWPGNAAHPKGKDDPKKPPKKK